MNSDNQKYKTVVVLLPGTTGSTLLSSYESKVPMWPDTVMEELKEAELKENEINLAVKTMESSAYPAGPILQIQTEQGTISTSYQVLKDFFENPSHFSDNIAYDWVVRNEQPPFTSSKLLIGYGYDWRNDNYSTASNDLASFLENCSYIDENTELVLLGHSMGGLVMRNLMDVVKYKAPGSIKLITMGTPHLGAPLALQGLLGEIQQLENINVGSFVEQCSNNLSSPSTAELLPPPFVDFVFSEDQETSYGIYKDALPSDFYNDLPSWGGDPSQGFVPVQKSLFDAAETAWGRFVEDTAANYQLIFAINKGGEPTNTSFIWNGQSGQSNIPQPQYTENDIDDDGVAQGGDSIVPFDSAIYERTTKSDNVFLATEFCHHNDIPAQPSVLNHIVGIIEGNS